MPAARRMSPGEWRSGAAAARRLDGNVFSQLDELARRLSDLGMADPAQAVRKAMETARDDPDKASKALKEVAASLAAQAPAYSHGLRELLGRLPEFSEAPTAKVTDDDGIPDMAPH